MKKSLPARILLIRFSSAGDIILLSALMRCIKKTQSDVVLDFVTRADMAGLVENNPHLDNIYRLERSSGSAGLRKLIGQLKENDYGLVIDAHGSFRSRLIRKLLKPTAQTVLDKKSLRRFLLIHYRINLLKDRKRLMEEYFSPLKKYGVEYDGKGTEMIVSDSCREKMSPLFVPFEGKPLIGIAPGSSWPKKSYPMDRFKYIAEKILSETDAGIVLLGGPEDEKMKLDGMTQPPGHNDTKEHKKNREGVARAPLPVSENMPDNNNRMLDLQGKTALEEAAFAAGQCRLVLTNDSLFLHLAEAAGKDAFAIFGPTVREFGYFPFRATSRVFETDTLCRPCTKNGDGRCFRNERFCITRISAEDILMAVLERID